MQAVAGRLRAAKSLLILTHARPDGDGLGSMVALAEAAQRAGKEVHMLVPDTVPARYQFLFDGKEPAGPPQFDELAGKAELIVLVDTCALSQLDSLAGAIRRRRDKVVVIDHHATADQVGTVQWQDTSAAAAGVMIGELLDELGWGIEGLVAEALATAVLADTGWLKFPNTDSRCLRMAAGLVEAGVRLDVLYRRICQQDRPQRLRLMARMLESLELCSRGRLAVMTILASDFAQTGSTQDETEDLINEAFRLGGVEAALLLVEQADCIRASLRSRGAIDVALIAQQFGGGGHSQAAGCRKTQDLHTFKQQLIATIDKSLAGTNPRR